MVAWIAPAPVSQPYNNSWSAQKPQRQVGEKVRVPGHLESQQVASDRLLPQDRPALRSQLLTVAGLSVLASLLLRELRSRRQNTSLAPLTALGAALGGLLSRLVPKLFACLQLIRSRKSVGDSSQGSTSELLRSRDSVADRRQPSASDAWAAYGSGQKSLEGARSGPRAFVGGGPAMAAEQHRYNSDSNWHRGDWLPRPEVKGEGKGKGKDKGKGKGKDKDKGKGDKGTRTWFEDDYDDPPFWWRNKKDVFFDIEMTHEEDLGSLANPVYQWWDPVKVAEAENFVALSKPAGMRVTTDENGLWEASPSNFIHVAHQRYDIGSTNEPQQRGICHRLDSHTSGVQIFGRSLEAFGHFTKENSGHRVQKEYLTLVDGRLGDEKTPGTGLIDLPIAKYKDFERRQFGSVICANQGLPAITKYKALRQWRVPAKGKMAFLGKDRWFTLVHLRILSGRTHQIRIHMAYIGHPVIGDIKHNNSSLEHDCAFLPRIFLHCLKMEFKEFDGSLFVASSELTPDLQAGLMHIQALGDDGAATSDRDKMPGLAQILKDSKQDNEVPYPDAPAGMAEATPPVTLKYRCAICKSCEEATCTMIQRRNRVAMTWKLTKQHGEDDNAEFGPPPKAKQQKEAGEKVWGPGELWCPTGLQDFEKGTGALVTNREAW